MRDHHRFPHWPWALFALSLVFVLAFARFAIDSGLELRQAGERIFDLSQLQAALIKNTCPVWLWADYITDHYVRTGEASLMQGNSLQNYAITVANVRRLARHFSHASEDSFTLFQRCIDLRKAGHINAAVQAYHQAMAANRIVYTDLDLIAVLGAGDEQALASLRR